MVKIVNLLLASVALFAANSCIPTGQALESAATTPSDKVPLPVFFLHGLGLNGDSARNIQAQLVADGRVFTPLTFCTDKCSTKPLNEQVSLAIEQIRNITANDPRYKHGYVLMGHSQGGTIARGVVEEMDDHKIKALVTLAGVMNGSFQGPQKEDLAALQLIAAFFGEVLVPATVFNFSSYAPADFHGKLQHDFSSLVVSKPELQSQFSAFNLDRSPYFAKWVGANNYFPRINNINVCADGDAKCAADKKRRRDNFLKLKEAHFFASPGDGVVTPWQTSHLAQYTEVASLEEVESKFATLQIVDMKQTREYVNDTYGIKTLDKRGGLFLHTVENTSHTCWLEDSAAQGSQPACAFQSVFDNSLRPALQGPGFFYTHSQC